MMKLSAMLAGCGLALLATTGSAAGLELGDRAPTLKIKEWVKGASFDLERVRGQKVVALEFWATWCAPCITHIPHLTELQAKHKKDLVVVGVTAEDPANSLEAVRKFVDGQGRKMGYTVAFDDGTATQKAYMDAMGMEHLPSAYIIDRSGRLVWAGYPDNEMDRALERALAGTLDVEQVKRRFKARQGIDAAMAKEDWPAALKRIDEYLRSAKLSADERVPLDWLRFECLARNSASASEANRVGAAVVGADQLLERLDSYAWQMLTDEAYGGRFNSLALAAAKRANELAGGRNASVLDTLARAHFAAGQVERAIELARQAIDTAEGPEKEFYRQSLAEYQAASHKGG
ncbi:MAG TPA: redoxin domain-containing protein [Phycisphaerae bacterium]|nr:redoxin domain-containing protein [Phycisphaerae bacterium]